MERKTAQQLWAAAHEKVETIPPARVAEELAGGDVLLLDVRLPIERERRGVIAGSKPVPRQVIEWWADPESPYYRPEGVFGDFERRTITYCDGGGNGTFAAVTLQELGYTNVATVEGGFFGWVAAGLPVVGAGE
jgi:rhodanese-related sulfurtransferase